MDKKEISLSDEIEDLTGFGLGKQDCNYISVNKIKLAIKKILERVDKIDKEYYHGDSENPEDCDICKIRKIIKEEMGGKLI